jgi:hypothetical protein
LNVVSGFGGPGGADKALPGSFAMPEAKLQAVSGALLFMVIFNFGVQRILLEYFAEWCKVSSGILVSR